MTIFVNSNSNAKSTNMFWHRLVSIILTLTTLLVFSTIGASQTLEKREDSLSVLLNAIIKAEAIEQKMALNQQFTLLLKETLSDESSMDYPFEKLKNIGILSTPSKKVRFFTWNIPQAIGKQVYYGLVQVKGKDFYNVFSLNDSRSEIANPQLEVLSPTKWWGALYYYVDERKVGGNNVYILLGVEMNNLFSTRRVIETLWFNDKNEPVFGAPIFSVNKQILSRVVFEYSARTNMVLKYLPEKEMIVFDHLSPQRPDLVGNYQFYGPDFSYDAFKFDKGMWVFTPDIDLRNAKRDKPATPIEAPEKNPEPGFLYLPDSKKNTDSSKDVQ